jgi:hypothetical protein
LGGVQLAHEQFVAHGGPGWLPAEFKRQAVALAQVEQEGDHQWCAVVQGYEAQLQMRAFGRAVRG